MRIREYIEEQVPSVFTEEYLWDKTVSPYKRTANPRVSSANTWWFNSALYPRVRRYMEDSVGTDGAFRECLHEDESNLFSADVVLTRALHTWGGNCHVRNLGPDDITSALDLRPVPEVDMDDMAVKALSHMIPRINKGISAVNFVLELKDLKRANPLPSIKRVFNRRSAFRDLLNARKRKEFFKELNTRLTGAHLNAEFGIKPFVRDVHDITVELLSLAERLAKLKSRVGERITRHFKRYILDEDDLMPTKEWVEGPLRPLAWSTDIRNDTTRSSGLRDLLYAQPRARWINRPVYHASVRYKYSLPALSEAEEKLATHLDALGVRLDPSIIWNAIPFSFLVDWVVDVSGFLRSFARDNFPINTVVTEFCHSLTSSAAYELNCIFTHASGTNADQPTTYGSIFGVPPYGDPFVQDGTEYRLGHLAVTRCWEGTRGEYVRRLSSPSLHVAQTQGASLRKAALVGSLLLQRKRAWNSRRFERYKPRGSTL